MIGPHILSYQTIFIQTELLIAVRCNEIAMTYVIKNYSEEFLEKQVEIGTAVLENWSGSNQTGVEGLKQRYGTTLGHLP